MWSELHNTWLNTEIISKTKIIENVVPDTKVLMIVDKCYSPKWIKAIKSIMQVQLDSMVSKQLNFVEIV